MLVSSSWLSQPSFSTFVARGVRVIPRDTSGYRGRAGSSRSAGPAWQRVEQQTGLQDIPAELWVDHQGRLRGAGDDRDHPAPGRPELRRRPVTAKLTDYGTIANISTPPAPRPRTSPTRSPATSHCGGSSPAAMTYARSRAAKAPPRHLLGDLVGYTTGTQESRKRPLVINASHA